MKYIALLLAMGCCICNCDSWLRRRFSLSNVDFSQIKSGCMDILSSPIIMTVTCWLIGDKLLSRAMLFPAQKITMNIAIAITTLSLAEIARGKVGSIRENKYIKKTSPELKIAAAYTLGTIGYAAAAALPIPSTLKYYDKYNLFTLASGFLFTRVASKLVPKCLK